jgi:hypothetical protein
LNLKWNIAFEAVYSFEFGLAWGGVLLRWGEAETWNYRDLSLRADPAGDEFCPASSHFPGSRKSLRDRDNGIDF